VGLERCEIDGMDARIVIDDACEVLTFSPQRSPEREVHHHLGGMRSFGETFASRIDAWLQDLKNGTLPEDVDGSGEDALKVQLIIEAAIEAAIESWEQGRVIEV
jgi:predicted dehydrogenase